MVERKYRDYSLKKVSDDLSIVILIIYFHPPHACTHIHLHAYTIQYTHAGTGTQAYTQSPIHSDTYILKVK